MSGLGEMGGDVEEALEAISVPSYVLDAAGVSRWLYPAARRLAGDVRGRHFTSIVAPEESRRAREVFARNISGTATVTDVEGSILDREGTRTQVEISSVPLKKGGSIVGVFGQILDVADEPPPPPHPTQTPRQTEVLRMLERGRSTQQIADDFNLSKETVRNHVRQVLRGLGASSRLEAVALSRRRNAAAPQRVNSHT